MKSQWWVAKNGHKSCILKVQLNSMKAMSQFKGYVAEYFDDSKVVSVQWLPGGKAQFTLENGAVVSLHTLPNQLVAQAMYGLTYYEASNATYNQSWGIA